VKGFWLMWEGHSTRRHRQTSYTFHPHQYDSCFHTCRRCLGLECSLRHSSTSSVLSLIGHLPRSFSRVIATRCRSEIFPWVSQGRVNDESCFMLHASAGALCLASMSTRHGEKARREGWWEGDQPWRCLCKEAAFGRLNFKLFIIR
jgi:hypothetical protein